MTTLTKPQPANIRPELQLLLHCAQTSLETQNPDRTPTFLQNDLDWNYLFNAASHYKIIPLLYCYLNKQHPEAVPKSILSQLRNAYHLNTQRNLSLTEELLSLLKLFENQSIPIIPFKGPALAASAYGNLSLRQSGDLDLLIKKEHFPQAQTLLLERNYQNQFTKILEKSQTEIHYYNNETQIEIDLHYGITPNYYAFSLNYEALSDNLVFASLIGQPIQTLSPENSLIVICINSWKDLFELPRIIDIAAIINAHPDLDWNLIVSRSVKYGAERILYINLFLTQQLLQTTLPKFIIRKINSDPLVHRIGNWAYKCLLLYPDGKPTMMEKWLFLLGSRERIQDQIKFLLHPTHMEFELISLPKSFSILYFLIRPIRLFIKYAPIAFNSFWTLFLKTYRAGFIKTF